jgi:hypothetical protein
MEPLTGLAPAVLLLTLGPFLGWTLLAHNAAFSALAGAAVQLFVACATVGLLLVFPDASLLWLAAGYAIAAAAGAVVWGINLKRLVPNYSLHIARITAAAVATLAIGFALRPLTPTLSQDRMGLGALFLIVGVAIGGAAVLVLLPEIPRSLFDWRNRRATSGRSTRGALGLPLEAPSRIHGVEERE